MPGFKYIQDFAYEASGARINNFIAGGTLPDETGYDETGSDQHSLSKRIALGDYIGTMAVEGIVMPVFLRSDGGHQVYNPGPVLVAPPTNFPGAIGAGFACCFAPGTGIDTPLGELSVEDMQIGDKVLTAEGRTARVKWIWRHTILHLFAGPHLHPVCIRAGALGTTALGQGVPHSDLVVTANHAMMLDGLAVPALALVNGTTIDRVAQGDLPECVTYYHIETDAHDVILANGAASETYIDSRSHSHSHSHSRCGFDNYQDYLTLYGTEPPVPGTMPHPVQSQRLFPDAIRALLIRAG